MKNIITEMINKYEKQIIECEKLNKDLEPEIDWLDEKNFEVNESVIYNSKRFIQDLKALLQIAK